MKRNIARIRINGKNLIKISYASDRSYMIAFPRMQRNDSYVESHMSFHTRNNRITFKITDFGDSKKDFVATVEEARAKGYHITPKGDIDLYKGKYLDEEDLKSKLVGIGQFGYDFKRDGFIEEVMGKTKTKDAKFQKVIDLNVPDDLRTASVAVYVSKNLNGNPADLVKDAIESPVQEQFFITDSIEKDVYTFAVLVRYTEKPKV